MFEENLKTYNFDIFLTLPQICTSPYPKLLKSPKLIISLMCILLKLDCEKFGVSNLFFKSYQRKTFGGIRSISRLLAKRRVNNCQKNGSLENSQRALET